MNVLNSVLLEGNCFGNRIDGFRVRNDQVSAIVDFSAIDESKQARLAEGVFCRVCGRLEDDPECPGSFVVVADHVDIKPTKAAKS